MFFRKSKKPKEKSGPKIIVPDGLWLKCESCSEILYKKELEKNIWTCPKCNFHFRIPSRKYIELLLDEGKLEEFNIELKTVDALQFPKYEEKFKDAQEKTSLNEGVIAGKSSIGNQSVVFVATDFAFMGGSMGSVVGETVAYSIRQSQDGQIPLIILTASGGGARMQEGIFSLMQMAKTSAELAILSKNRIPYISVLTHPTMAGVMASFASLGDIIIAEPGALLGFTGPRVIEQTIGEKLPAGFQRSEFLLEHGMVDIVVHRRDLKQTLIRTLNILFHKS